MNYELSDQHKEWRNECRAWIAGHITPYANDWDRAEEVPRTAISALASAGYLGATIPTDYGGQSLDPLSYALLTEEMGKACSSMRSLLTVHCSLVAETLARWGSREQKERWLPSLASGEKLAAFALSEPETGSDAKNVQCRFEQRPEGFLLNGVKKWTTFGEYADLLLVLARDDAGVSAFLLERETPGLEVRAIRGMLGTRASMLAELRMQDCLLPPDALLGRSGLGFLQIANTALDNGRFSVACGALGICKAALDAAGDYARRREQFGKPLAEFQLIRRRLAQMATDSKAAQLLCYNAAALRADRKPNAILQTAMAKYFASEAAVRVADHAVQIHGALGCHDALSLQRYYRDARILTIIEGSSEMQELLLGEQAASSPDALLDS